MSGTAPELGLLRSRPPGHAWVMTDLRQRVPGHSLVDELLRQWDLGAIRVDERSNGIVIDDEAVSWYRGVLGERRVAAELARLGEHWVVLHSVPVGRGSSDIDHVVIGPPGVFTINTKYSPGKSVWVAGYGLFVDGQKTRYVPNSMTEASRAADLLSRACGLTVPVTAIITFVDPGEMSQKAPAGDGENGPPVMVLGERQLLAAMNGRAVFSPEQTARIANAAILPSTWHMAPKPSTVGAHIIKEFEALELAVGPRLEGPRVIQNAPTDRTARAGRGVTRGGGRMPARRGRASTRRRRASPLERLIGGLVMPAVVFIAAWIWLNSLAGR